MGNSNIIRKDVDIPEILQIIDPDVKGKIIASWPAKNFVGRVVFLINVYEKGKKRLGAVTDPNFKPELYHERSLICFVDMAPDSPDDSVEIRLTTTNYVKGFIVC